MKYTVTWHPSAKGALARIWVDAADKAAVTAAANQIDALLKRDPIDAGESREPPTRFLLVSPLAIYFDVSPDDRLVEVHTVWRR